MFIAPYVTILVDVGTKGEIMNTAKKFFVASIISNAVMAPVNVHADQCGLLVLGMNNTIGYVQSCENAIKHNTVNTVCSMYPETINGVMALSQMMGQTSPQMHLCADANKATFVAFKDAVTKGVALQPAVTKAFAEMRRKEGEKQHAIDAEADRLIKKGDEAEHRRYEEREAEKKAKEVKEMETNRLKMEESDKNYQLKREQSAEYKAAEADRARQQKAHEDYEKAKHNPINLLFGDLLK